MPKHAGQHRSPDQNTSMGGTLTIKKIISGGQTGADRAALDVAILLDIAHGGWISKGRRTENGRLPAKYNLREMPTTGYIERTEKNVIDSEGTLIVSHGELTGGSALTPQFAEKYSRPWLHIDLNSTPAFRAAGSIKSWIEINGIEVLNVAGPRASKDARIYQTTVEILRTVFYMELIDNSVPDPVTVAGKITGGVKCSGFPTTMDEAVNRLIAELSFKEKTKMANLPPKKLVALTSTLGKHVINEFALGAGNNKLMEACRQVSGGDEIHPDQAALIIMMQLWEKLQTVNVLRVVK